MNNAPPTTHRISEFHKWQKENCLEIQPPFQRKPVWSEKNRSYLIDTILNGYPVPEIYVQVKTDKDGNTNYVIVDGQQRIRSILDFIEGEITILDSESTKFANKEFKNLSDGAKKDFWDYPLVTRELKTEDDDEIRHIFRRLNKYVVPLNEQELRNATFRGKFITLMNELGEDDYWVDNKLVTSEDVRRMRDVEFVSELFIAMMDAIKERKDLDNYYKLYDVNFDGVNEWKKHFIKNQTQITDILGELRGTKWNSKSDFYSLFISISDFLKNYYYPQENYEKIKNSLTEFRKKVNLEKEESKDKNILDYYHTLQGGVGQKENRTKRTNILKNIILPYLIPKDNKRFFTEEQRQLAWDLSENKKCSKCGKGIEWSQFELDHKTPHSKGGITSLKNSQIMHKSCNASKGNK